MTGALEQRRAAYESAVRGLRDEADDLLAQGTSKALVAKHMVDRRNALKAEYRVGLDPTLLALIEQRNVARYGDPLGPDRGLSPAPLRKLGCGHRRRLPPGRLERRRGEVYLIVMKLLDLPDGRVSLEFAPSERDGVLAALAEQGGTCELIGAYELVTERGERFAYVDEWDEPCLISTGPSGDLLLREIAGQHAKSSRRRPATRKIDSARLLGHS